MRKIKSRSLIIGIALICVVIWALTAFVGCGNQAILSPGNFNFKHIHLTDMTQGYCATVEKWWDTESGIEVRTSEFGSIYCSEGSYILFEDSAHCPYCH